jgi:uncharacterized protein YbjT (DUF2867 family)
MRVLIAGSTGYLGRHLLHAARAEGHTVRALVRSEAKLGADRESVDEVFVGQATDDATLEGVCAGIDVVITALGNRTFQRRPHPLAVDRDANLNLLRRAEAAGVRRFVFVSVLRGEALRTEVPQIEAREQVVDALRSSSVPWTVIRPSGFFNDMTEFLEMARKGSVYLLGDGRAPFNPIDGADLAAFIMKRAVDEATIGQELPVGGPEVLDQHRVGELAFAALGTTPRLRATPLWLVRGAARLVLPFNVNLGSFLAMLSALAVGDATAPQTGERTLADFFNQVVAEGTDLRAGR